MPRLQSLGESGFTAELGTVLPAVTCSVQSTFLTGACRATTASSATAGTSATSVRCCYGGSTTAGGRREVLGDRTARRPDYRVANVCWWYAMGADLDTTVTPRPAYHADGRKSPDCWTWPPQLHDALTRRLGTFPLFNYWGPTASIESSRWIVEAARRVMPDHDLTLVYVPHLDYDLQRHGPDARRRRRPPATSTPCWRRCSTTPRPQV